MLACTWRKLDRAGNVLAGCALARQKDSVYCPRHTFLHNVSAAAQLDKETAAKAKRAGTQVVANTRAGMITRGYQFTGNNECSGCGERIEWWRTPNGRQAPYNPMPDENSHATSHFATCTRSKEFRRAS